MLLKKFKANILNDFWFSSCFLLLAIDKINQIDKWNKTFELFYAEIKKIQKKIFLNVLFLKMSVTLTKNLKLCIFNKIDFQKDYQLL